MLLIWSVEELNIDHSGVFALGLFCICIIFCIFQLCGPLVAEGNKLYGREPEVEFVTHVTHGGGVKFLPVV